MVGLVEVVFVRVLEMFVDSSLNYSLNNYPKSIPTTCSGAQMDTNCKVGKVENKGFGRQSDTHVLELWR